MRDIKSVAASLRHQYRGMLSATSSTQRDLRSKLLSSNRSKFYQKFVYSSNNSNPQTSVVWDPSTKTNTSLPSEVKTILVSEASKILNAPTTPPDPPPEWFHALYSSTSLSIPPDTWDELCSPLTCSEIRTSLQGPSKAPGFDGISNKLLQSAISYPSPSPVSCIQHLTNLSNLWYLSGECPPSCALGKMCLIPKPGKKIPTAYTSQRPLTLQPEPSKVVLRTLHPTP